MTIGIKQVRELHQALSGVQLLLSAAFLTSCYASSAASLPPRVAQRPRFSAIDPAGEYVAEDGATLSLRAGGSAQTYEVEVRAGGEVLKGVALVNGSQLLALYGPDVLSELDPAVFLLLQTTTGYDAFWTQWDRASSRWAERLSSEVATWVPDPYDRQRTEPTGSWLWKGNYELRGVVANEPRAYRSSLSVYPESGFQGTYLGRLFWTTPAGRGVTIEDYGVAVRFENSVAAVRVRAEIENERRGWYRTRTATLSNNGQVRFIIAGYRLTADALDGAEYVGEYVSDNTSRYAHVEGQGSRRWVRAGAAGPPLDSSETAPPAPPASPVEPDPTAQPAP